jgi:hypothetical protein
MRELYCCRSCLEPLDRLDPFTFYHPGQATWFEVECGCGLRFTYMKPKRMFRRLLLDAKANYFDSTFPSVMQIK